MHVFFISVVSIDSCDFDCCDEKSTLAYFDPLFKARCHSPFKACCNMPIIVIALSLNGAQKKNGV